MKKSKKKKSKSAKKHKKSNKQATKHMKSIAQKEENTKTQEQEDAKTKEDDSTDDIMEKFEESLGKDDLGAFNSLPQKESKKEYSEEPESEKKPKK